MPYIAKDEVKAALDAAGISYDSDATREELVALMPDDEPAEKPKGKTIAMRLKRDRWDDSGQRIRKGEVVQMDTEAAMDAVEAGTAERVK